MPRHQRNRENRKQKNKKIKHKNKQEKKRNGFQDESQKGNNFPTNLINE